MKPYQIGIDISGLVDLPPLESTPGYDVLEGHPRASVRYDRGSAGSAHRLGLWRCTPGTFTCTEKGDELQTVLEGRLVLIGENGQHHELGPGDSVYTVKGQRVTWKVVETVTKVFFTHDAAAG